MTLLYVFRGLKVHVSRQIKCKRMTHNDNIVENSCNVAIHFALSSQKTEQQKGNEENNNYGAAAIKINNNMFLLFYFVGRSTLYSPSGCLIFVYLLCIKTIFMVNR